MELSGFGVIWQNLDYLIWGNFPGGIVLTVLISFVAIVIASLIGLVGGIGLTVLTSWPRQLLIIALSFLRAIPVIMLIFWCYFLLPVLLGLALPAITTVIIALSLIGGAYLAHSVNAGIQAVGKSQWQTAYSLGMSQWQVIFYVILPQALKIMLPSFINQWVAIIKDSSLAYVVGVAEFTFVATQINNRSMIYPTELFSFVILVYFVLCFSLNWLAVSLSNKIKWGNSINSL